MGSASDPAEETGSTAIGDDADQSADFRTFLIADIRGYTSYTDERGDEAAAALARQFAGLVRETVTARDGTLVELRGDEALTVFRSARQALRAAVELQARFVADGLPRGVGIGLDAGEAVPVEGGYRGTALNVAARLCAQAAAGEILATETVIHLAARIEGIRYREPRAIRLKGFESPVRVVGVQAETAPATGAGRRGSRVAVARPLGRRPAFAALVAVAVLVVGGALAFTQGLGGRGSAAPGGSNGGSVAAGPGQSSGSLGASLAPGASGGSGAVTGPGGSPGPSPAPAADVPGYKGGLARTNQTPGPGPAGTPQVAWQLRTTADMSASPAVAGNLVFAGGNDGILHVIDIATGQERWTFAAGAPINTAPAVAGGSVYVTTEDRVFHAIDLASHAERWRVPGVSSGVVPTVLDDLAYVGLGAGQFTALSTADGSVAWHVDVEGSVSRIAVADNVAYLAGEDGGRIYAVDLASHAIRWTVDTGATSVLTPAIDGGTVYATLITAAGKGSRLIALDASTGHQRWAFTPSDKSALYSLAVGPELAYTSSDNPSGTTVWAIDRSTGDERWRASVPSTPGVHPTVSGDGLYLSSVDGLVELVAATGKEIWRSDAVGRLAGPAVVTGGLAIVNANAGRSGPGVVAVGSAPGSAAAIPASAIEWVADLTAGDNQSALYLHVITDAKGNVYAADRVGNRVVIWDRNGRPTSWGTHGSKPGQFDFSEVTPNDQSQSVAIAPDGRIAVADGGNHRVQVFDSKRHFLKAIGHYGTEVKPGQMVNPCCIAFGPDGRLYVADAGRGDIQVFDKKGRFIRVIGSQGSGNGQFDRLGVPYVDPATGDLWVPDFANRRIEVMTPEGQYITSFGDEPDEQAFNETNGVVLDSAGRMFVVDTDDLLYILDPTGRRIASFGPEIVAGHGVVRPAYVWLTADGRLYLPDTANSRVAVFQLRDPLWPPPGG